MLLKSLLVSPSQTIRVAVHSLGGINDDKSAGISLIDSFNEFGSNRSSQAPWRLIVVIFVPTVIASPWSDTRLSEVLGVKQVCFGRKPYVGLNNLRLSRLTLARWRDCRLLGARRGNLSKSISS